MIKETDEKYRCVIYDSLCYLGQGKIEKKIICNLKNARNKPEITHNG